MSRDGKLPNDPVRARQAVDQAPDGTGRKQPGNGY